MSLRARLILCLLVPLLMTAALTSAVATLSLLQAQTELAEARYRFGAGQLRSAIESGLTLGLPLEDLRQTSELLSRTATRDTDIAAILVFDAAGIVRHGTDPGRVGEAVPAAWRDVAEPAAAVAVDDRPGSVVVAPLFNSYGDVAGGLALRFGHLAETVRIEQTVAVVAGVAMLLGAVAAAVAVVGAGACLAGPQRLLTALSARFAAFAAKPEVAAQTGESGIVGADLGGAGRAFESRAAAAWRVVADRQAEIERLDELA